MPSSQLLSSFLCIGCLTFVANGLSTIYTPTSRMVSHVPSHDDVIPRPEQSRADRRARHTDLRAAKKTSKSSASSSSDKVKEMAAFLSVQLLEKVMAEVMNPEAESKMDLAAVERITKALQMSSQPSEEKTTIKEEKPKVTTELPMSTPTENSKVGVDDDDSSSSTAEMETLENPTIEAKDEINVTKEEEIVAPVAETPAPPPSTPEIKVKPLEVVQSNIPALRPESIPQRKPDTEEATDATELAEDSLVEEMASETPEEVVEKTESSEATADDGAAIDATASDTDEINTATTHEEEIDTATADAEEIDTVTTDAEEIDTAATDAEEIDTEEIDTATTDAEEINAEVIDTAAILEEEKAEESFHRRLLKQKLEYDDAHEIRIENEKDKNKEDEKEVDVTSSPAAEVTSDEGIEEESDDDSSSDSVTSESVQTESETTGVSDLDESKKDTNEDKEEPTEAESDSDDVKTGVLSETIEAGDEEVPPLTAATTSPPTTSERRVETIVALRQPKSTDEESKLAEKYAEMMSLEDRAYALLCDLGMIEAHKNPEDPSYDHSKDDEYCEQRFLPLL